MGRQTRRAGQQRDGGKRGSVALAFVHHANQYLITNSYESRSDLEEVIGQPGSPCGYLRVTSLIASRTESPSTSMPNTVC